MSDFQRPEWAERFRPPDHLWPARPEYLRRRSTVVRATGILAGRLGVVESVVADILYLCWDHRGDHLTVGCTAAPTLLRIDLRDVTARAHAAMAWTVVGPPPCADVNVKVGGQTWTTEHETLCRMRCMDESVTVAEARAALGWAESVAGVSDVSR